MKRYQIRWIETNGRDKPKDWILTLESKDERDELLGHISVSDRLQLVWSVELG